jgi:hypothetical protein
MCKGTMQYVHNECLVQWMLVCNESKGESLENNNFNCDICGTRMIYTTITPKTTSHKIHAFLMAVTVTTLMTIFALFLCAMFGFVVGSASTSGTIRFIKPLVAQKLKERTACPLQGITQAVFSSNHSLLVYSETMGRCTDVKVCDVMNRDCKIAFRKISLESNQKIVVRSLSEVSNRWTAYWRVRLDVRAHRFQNWYVLSDFLYLGLVFLCIAMCILNVRSSEYAIILGMELVQLLCVFIGLGYMSVFDDFNVTSTSIFLLPLQNLRYIPLFLVIVCASILPVMMFVHVYNSLCRLVFYSFMHPSQVLSEGIYIASSSNQHKIPDIHFENTTSKA